MSAAHTHGPWHVHDIGNPNFVFIQNKDLESVAKVFSFRNSDEGKANAALFAAVPDLLKAIKGLYSAIESGRQWKAPADVVESWLPIASAAIDKAEGRS